jgi:hypothetical protein
MHRAETPAPRVRPATDRVDIRDQVNWLVREVAILEQAHHGVRQAVQQLHDAADKVEPLVSRIKVRPDQLEESQSTEFLRALQVYTREATFVHARITHLMKLLDTISTAGQILTRVLPHLLAEARIQAVVQDRIRRALKPLIVAHATPDRVAHRAQAAVAKLAVALLRSQPSLTQRQFDALVPKPLLSTRGRRQAFTPALVQAAYEALSDAHQPWKHDALVDTLAKRLNVSKRTIDSLLSRARRRS